MRISKHQGERGVGAYTMWLSAAETERWAERPGNRWPCSQLSGRRLRVDVDATGIYDLAINGKCADCDGRELDAIVSDHLPGDCRHLWPCWE